MAFWSKLAQALPLSGNVNQNVLQDEANNLYPMSHNESNSGGRLYTAITGAAATSCANGPGRLCRIHCLPGGTIGAVTVYDNPSGASGQVLYGPYTPVPGSYVDLQLPVQNGVTVQTALATNLLVTVEM